MIDWEECPNPGCNNQGYTIEKEIYASAFDGREYGLEKQVQCEFCYTNDNSIFNYNQLIKRIKGEHLK